MVGREMMLGNPPRLDVASQHGMLTPTCFSSRKRSSAPALSSPSRSKLARASSRQTKQAYAGSHCLPLMACVRCLLDVSVKWSIKVKLLQREEQLLAPMAPREPSKWVRMLAARAKERSSLTLIDRRSIYKGLYFKSCSGFGLLNRL